MTPVKGATQTFVVEHHDPPHRAVSSTVSGSCHARVEECFDPVGPGRTLLRTTVTYTFVGPGALRRAAIMKPRGRRAADSTTAGLGQLFAARSAVPTHAVGGPAGPMLGPYVVETDDPSRTLTSRGRRRR